MTELGRLIGKEKSSIHTIINNSNPTLETLSKIAKALDVNVADLIVEEPRKEFIECPRCGLKLYEVK